jgi:hypothetical protein
MSMTLETFKSTFYQYIKTSQSEDIEKLVSNDLASTFPDLAETHKPNLKMLADVLHEAATTLAAKLPTLLAPRTNEASALNEQLPPTEQMDVSKLTDAGWLAKTAYTTVAAIQTDWLKSTPLGTFQEVILERPEKANEWCESFKQYVEDSDKLALTVAGHLADREVLDPLRQKVKSAAPKVVETPTIPPGQQAVRDAGSGLAQVLGNPQTKKNVLTWLKSVSSGASSETQKDVLAVFNAQVIKDATVLEAVLKVTTLSRSEIQSMPAFKFLPPFKANQLLDTYRPDEEIERQKQIAADKAVGEQFLSSSYRLINPLLAAFDFLKVDPSLHTSGGYDYEPIKDNLLKAWKRIAVERKYAVQQDVEGWDYDAIANTYKNITAIQRSWENFDKPEIPGGVVARGDSAVMYTAYPVLDPRKNNYKDGEVTVSGTITWPGIMSTTVGDPKQHGFIQAKTVIWCFNVDSVNAGRSIGSINPSEQEVTFPLGVKVVLQKLIVRVNDKTIQQGDFGSVAELIAFAKLV